MRYSKSGFTLIELLVVIAIIGVLSSVVLVSLDQARARARFGTMMAQLQEIRAAAEMYRTSEGAYAPDVGSTGTPDFVDEYLPKWPEPPCSNYRYDWENWGNRPNGSIVRVSVRDPNLPSNHSLFYLCLKPDDLGLCIQSSAQHQGENILTTDISSLDC